MNKFIQAIKEEDNVTVNEKGGLAYKSTLNANLDLFGKIGVPNNNAVHLFNSAKYEDRITAYKILLWSRDIINGAGLRKNFIEILKDDNPVGLKEILLKSIEFGIGYWKDILKFNNVDFFTEWFNAIQRGDRLAAKWFPRKGHYFNKLADMVKGKSAARKFLVINSDTVETKVCAKNFDSINYSQIPSKSMKLHAKTFQKFDNERYSKFIQKVKTGEAKINAKTLYPHEVLYSDNTWDVREALWKNLPNFIEDSISYLPVLDCSGSMTSGGRNLVAPIQVAYSLGIYCSERNKSVFKDKLLTFSANPHWVELSGDLKNKQRLLNRHSEVANTNLQAVFELILNTAINHKVEQSDLPNYLLIISDGQFDVMCDSSTSRYERDYNTVFQKYEVKFKESGYRRPNIVFWNVANAGATPFTIRDSNVTTVSGNSPSVMRFIGNPDPINLMNKTIEKYSWVEQFI